MSPSMQKWQCPIDLLRYTKKLCLIRNIHVFVCLGLTKQTCHFIKFELNQVYCLFKIIPDILFCKPDILIFLILNMSWCCPVLCTLSNKGWRTVFSQGRLLIGQFNKWQLRCAISQAVSSQMLQWGADCCDQNILGGHALRLGQKFPLGKLPIWEVCTQVNAFGKVPNICRTMNRPVGDQKKFVKPSKSNRATQQKNHRRIRNRKFVSYKISIHRNIINTVCTSMPCVRRFTLGGGANATAPPPAFTPVFYG